MIAATATINIGLNRNKKPTMMIMAVAAIITGLAAHFPP